MLHDGIVQANKRSYFFRFGMSVQFRLQTFPDTASSLHRNFCSTLQHMFPAGCSTCSLRLQHMFPANSVESQRSALTDSGVAHRGEEEVAEIADVRARWRRTGHGQCAVQWNRSVRRKERSSTEIETEPEEAADRGARDIGLVGLSATQICGGEQTHARGRKPTLEGTSGGADSGGEQAPAGGRKHAPLELDGARCGEISGARSREPACRSLDRGDLDWDGDDRDGDAA